VSADSAIDEPSGGAPPATTERRAKVHHYFVTDVARARLVSDWANWRLWLTRIVTNGLAVVVTVLVLPGLRVDRWYLGIFVLTGLVFGLLNAVVKPIIQFFALRYLVVSYGFVVVLINAFLLAMLSWILGNELAWRGVLPLLVGGLLVGALGLVFETIAGATPPILDHRHGNEEDS
jgi:putative membrane protein